MPEPDAGPLPFADLLRAEDRHFWFRARNAVLAQTARRLTRGWPAGYRMLEVGCGNGNVLRALAAACPGAVPTGSELFPEAVENARRRLACEVVRADVYRLPFRDPFRLVGMFDVLEHLPDDVAALRSLRGVTAGNGRLLLTVPAYMALWSHTDVSAGHYRRYTPAGLRDVLTEAGWRVESVSPFMTALVPLVWAGRKAAAVLNYFRPAARRATAREMAVGELRVVPLVNGLLTALLAAEAPFVARGVRFPVGTSLLAVAAPADAAARRAA